MGAQVNFVQSINQAMLDAMADDPSVLLLGEDVADEEGGGVVKVTAGLSSAFGTDRVRSTPITEEAIIGAAVGSALVGKRPIAEIMLMNFLTVGMDQIVNHAAKLRFMLGGAVSVPGVMRFPAGSGTGAAAQHSQSLEAWLGHVPGLKVVQPSTPEDAKGLLLAALAVQFVLDGLRGFGIGG